jgi:ABC-type dipeptide/oligopeptide/nickel transport system permease subunit
MAGISWRASDRYMTNSAGTLSGVAQFRIESILTQLIMKIYLRFPAILALLCAAAFFGGCGNSSTSGSDSPTHPSATPQVKSISPTAVPAGAASLTLTITGSGFESDSTVQVGGVAVQATFISSSEITATVPASALNSGGQFTVVVSNGALSSSGNTQTVSLLR